MSKNDRPIRTVRIVLPVPAGVTDARSWAEGVSNEMGADGRFAVFRPNLTGIRVGPFDESDNQGPWALSEDQILTVGQVELGYFMDAFQGSLAALLQTVAETAAVPSGTYVATSDMSTGYSRIYEKP